MEFTKQILLIQLLAFALAVCGTYVLQTAWRKATRRWPLILSGWGLIIASLLLWGKTTAADKGVALGLVAWVVIALVFLGFIAYKTPQADRQKRKPKSQSKDVTGVAFDRSRLWKNVLTFMLMGPLAGLAGMMIATFSLVFMNFLGVEYTANLTMATLAFPLLWGGLAVGIAYQKKMITRVVTVVALAGGSLLATIGLNLSL